MIVITSWALDSYLNLTHQKSISREDFINIIRPDVLLLNTYEDSRPPKFANSKFWSPADYNGSIIRGAYKMKWHNLGDRSIQLRLQVGLLDRPYLVEAYVKKGAKMEARKAAKFKVRLELIRKGQYVECGRLT